MTADLEKAIVAWRREILFKKTFNGVLSHVDAVLVETVEESRVTISS